MSRTDSHSEITRRGGVSQNEVRHICISMSSLANTFDSNFYIHGSVHRNSILIRYNKMQQYAGIYLLQNHSLHVSGVHRTHHQENKTVTAASGTGHSI